MKIIVVAVDFSDATPLVLKLAINFARMFPAELRLIHVIEPQPVYTAYGFTPEEFPAMNDFLTEAGRRAESKLAELLAVAQLDVPSATSQLTHGSPLNSLLECIDTIQPDFVIVGSHGHGVLASLLLGSVAEGMVRKATVPTLVVPVRG